METEKDANTIVIKEGAHRCQWLAAAVFSLSFVLFSFPGVAPCQVIKAQIYTNDVDGQHLRDVDVSYIETGQGCEFRLEYAPPATVRPIKEVSGDRGTPQRKTAGLACLVPGMKGWSAPSFVFTQATDKRLYEEQTAYYWVKTARDYAVKRLWITPPGIPGQIKFATQAVQPNVLTESNFNTACYDRGAFSTGCMKAWPHEEIAKIHIKTGCVNPDVIAHEFGHYAAGFVFGHMDATGFTVPAVLGDSEKFTFQEATADMFKALLMHDARYTVFLAKKGYGVVDPSQTAKWPPATQHWYDSALPLVQAFSQSLWGADASNTIKVDWRLDMTKPGVKNDPELANRTMANAFAYALAVNKGQRVDVLAKSILEWMDAHEPKRAGQIRKIFASHGFFGKQLGTDCKDHAECESFRCDNRFGAGCVSQDGRALSGEICTTHQQCRSGYCIIMKGDIKGFCSTTGKKSGDPCVTNAECLSGVCHGPSGYRCVANRNGKIGEFCTDHAQCSSNLYCKVPPGMRDGICSAR